MRMSQSLGNEDYEEIRQFDGLQVRMSHDQFSERKKGEEMIMNYTESLGILGENTRDTFKESDFTVRTTSKVKGIKRKQGDALDKQQ